MSVFVPERYSFRFRSERPLPALPADDALPTGLLKLQPVTRVPAFAGAREGSNLDKFL